MPSVSSHTILVCWSCRQVIDTPGILDHSLEERNTIEMQAIIALAHLSCSVLYFVDVSEQCGYTIDQQCSLFRSIKPLFANKQLIGTSYVNRFLLVVVGSSHLFFSSVVVNKIDQQPWDTLDTDKKTMVQALADDANCSLMTMSNVSEVGVSEVKIAACDKLLASRVDARISGKKIDGIMNRLQVFQPTPRDDVKREPFIPESVKRAREEGAKKPQRSRIGYAETVDDDNDEDDAPMTLETARKSTRDMMWENGGPGVWAPDYREQYDLENDDWKFDSIPEIIDGKNIADFVDPDILKKLEALEQEEDQILSEMEAAKMNEEPESDLDEEEEAAVSAIRARKKIIKARKLATQTQNKPMVPLSVRGKGGALDTQQIKEKMDSIGVDSSKMLERGRSTEKAERARKRERSLSRKLEKRKDSDHDEMDIDEDGGTKRARVETTRSDVSEALSHSKPQDLSKMGLKDKETIQKAKKLDYRGRLSWKGGAGEGDNRKSVHLVKWMNTGKKRMGTHYCR